MQTTLDDLDALIVDFDRTLGSLDDATLDAVPDDGGWTARQILGHLLLTARLYDERMQAKIATLPKPRGDATRPHKPGWFAGMLLKWLPDAAKRFKAPKLFDPTRTEERFDVAGLLAVHRTLRETGGQIQALGIGAVRFGTPVSRLLRMSLADGVAVQVAHGRRHLEQIRRVAGLPAAA